MRIRPARRAELPLLQDIERAAGEPFRTFGMHTIADDEPPPLDVLEDYTRAGRCWVAAEEPDDHPVGYLLADRVDGAAHIEQVSVDPKAARRGVGRALIERLADWAEVQGLDSLTLTTFTGVPWNAPYYERIGFRTLAAGEVGEELREIRNQEAEHGLDRWPRVCMRRRLPPHPGA
ncbi:GNAT family N-acetyltransferase [Streptomyces sp. NBC_01754]|uniref:GNAT family N-acetyltransferase n=1 Tax=Streptomyces sp. NBC_01754 TaxID=2975930 RepID=UPI002DDAA9A8|nr:GNAT family N-acetyltransferase [Streptomyces sp. NBC_01754]WSC95772.1 GNAT family N-acetyltransferase [Streptomyces sp. NBC_01754]